MTFPNTPLPIKVGLDLVGDGSYSTDISTSVQQRQDVTVNRGRPDEAQQIQPSDCSFTLNNRSNNFSLRNPNGIYYGQIGRNTPIRVAIDQPTSWLSINTETGNTPVAGVSVTTPDAASLDIVGDIEMLFDADLDSWSETMELISKWTTAGNQRSYALSVFPTGQLILWWSTTGSDTHGFTSQKLPVLTGRLAVKVTLDVDNTAGQSACTFYTASTISGPWTQLGPAQLGLTTTSIFSSSAILAVLDNPNSDIGGSVIRGRVYGATVRSGIAGTTVANPDFTVQSEGATSFVDTATPAKTWTVNGAVSLTKHDPRFIGEVSEWPISWDTTGLDVYVQLSAAGIMRRLSQGKDALRSSLRRGIDSLTNVVAYWPMEDGSNSTSIAAGISGEKAMTWTGNPQLSTNSGFVCSLPVPELNGAIFTGIVSPYATTGDAQVDWNMAVPAGGMPNNSIPMRIFCGGTAARWDVTYTTGGALTLTAYDSDGTSLGGSAPIGFAVDGENVRCSVELDTSGGNVNYSILTLQPGGFGLASGGTLAGNTITAVTKVVLNPKGNIMDTGFGHVAVQSSITSILTEGTQLNAYIGETAGRRVQRLCREEGVSIQGFGDLDDTSPMGPQTAMTLLNLLQECADTDMGILGESKDVLGISYRPRTSLINQVSSLTLPYTSLVQPFLPVEDDALIRNDVTVSRPDGSSARYEMATGAMGTADPPTGAGRYSDALSANTSTDDVLADHAAWRVHLGTVNEARYKSINVDLSRGVIASSPATIASLMALNSGDRIVVTSPPAGRTAPGDVSQLIQGMNETFNAFTWMMSINGSPESPWRVGVYQSASSSAISPTASKYSSDGTVLSVAVNSSATSWSISTPSGPLWTTSAAEFPFDWIVGGERVTVTAITGTGTVQTATVTRSVNGIVKAQTINTVIELFQPAVYGL